MWDWVRLMVNHVMNPLDPEENFCSTRYTVQEKAMERTKMLSDTMRVLWLSRTSVRYAEKSTKIDDRLSNMSRPLRWSIMFVQKRVETGSTAEYTNQRISTVRDAMTCTLTHLNSFKTTFQAFIFNRLDLLLNPRREHIMQGDSDILYIYIYIWLLICWSNATLRWISREPPGIPLQWCK